MTQTHTPVRVFLCLFNQVISLQQKRFYCSFIFLFFSFFFHFRPYRVRMCRCYFINLRHLKIVLACKSLEKYTIYQFLMTFLFAQNLKDGFSDNLIFMICFHNTIYIFYGFHTINFTINVQNNIIFRWAWSCFDKI